MINIHSDTSFPLFDRLHFGHDPNRQLTSQLDKMIVSRLGDYEDRVDARLDSRTT